MFANRPNFFHTITLGDYMFRIFSFKQVAVTAVILCILMIIGAVLNTFTPYIAVFSQTQAEIPIIMYHQISENESIFGDYVIPTALLKSDFQYMKENGITPISFADASDFVKTGKKLPKNPVIITFDDGERSFLTKVVPLLEEFRYHANINIVGALVDLYTENGDTDDRYAYLNNADIKILSENPLVELGCHSYNLHSLSERRGMGKLYGESDEDYKKIIEEDINKFNEKIKNLIGNVPTILAYPYGIRNDILFNFAKQSGFTVTLTCREAVNKITVGGDLYELGRYNRPYGKTSKEFFDKIYSR